MYRHSLLLSDWFYLGQSASGKCRRTGKQFSSSVIADVGPSALGYNVFDQLVIQAGNLIELPNVPPPIMSSSFVNNHFVSKLYKHLTSNVRRVR